MGTAADKECNVRSLDCELRARGGARRLVALVERVNQLVPSIPRNWHLILESSPGRTLTERVAGDFPLMVRIRLEVLDQQVLGGSQDANEQKAEQDW